MSWQANSISTPATEAEAEKDIAVAIAVELAAEFYGRDVVTAAALCAAKERDYGQESRYRFWLGVFKKLKSNPDFLADLRGAF